MRERTRLQSRLRWHLHELDPELQIRSRGLRSQRVVAHVAAFLDGRDGLLARIARALLERIGELNLRARELEREIARTVGVLAPTLPAIPGCDALTAAKIVGETAGVDRFRLKPPTRAGTGPHRNLSGRAIAHASDSHGPAIVKSTAPCTASPSPRRGTQASDTST